MSFLIYVIDMDKDAENVVLTETIDRARTSSEINDYAVWLDADDEEPAYEFLSNIAKNALLTPIPSEWSPCRRGEDVYYFNTETGDSVWEHPIDTLAKHVYNREKKSFLKCAHMYAGGSPKQNRKKTRRKSKRRKLSKKRKTSKRKKNISHR